MHFNILILVTHSMAHAVHFFVYDHKSKKPLLADLIIKHPETQFTLDSARTSVNGYYNFTADINLLQVEARKHPEYLSHVNTFSFVSNQDTIFIGLVKIEVPICYSFKEIEFAEHSSVLDSIALERLEQMKGIFNCEISNNRTIEIYGAAEETELIKDPELPVKRAQAVYKYLAENSDGNYVIKNLTGDSGIAGSGRTVFFKISGMPKKRIKIDVPPGR